MASAGRRKARPLLEDDGLVLVNLDAIFYVQLYCFCKYTAFDIFSFANQVLDCIAVIAANDVLGHDWTFIQVIGDIMTCCPNELNSPLECAKIRIGSYEGW